MSLNLAENVAKCPFASSFASFPDHREFSGTIILAILKLVYSISTPKMIEKYPYDTKMKQKDSPLVNA